MSTPELRISDTEREAAVASLGEHFAAGRLTRDEYDERAAAAFAARTASALRPLFVDLPAPHPFAAAPRAGASWPGTPRFGTAAGPPPPTPAGSRRPGFRLPFMPLVLVLVGLAILLGTPWLVFVGIGGLWLAKSRGRSWGGGCAPSYRSRAGGHGWSR